MSEKHRGAILSYFPNGFGFVRDLDTRGPGHFYHITRSPDLDPESIYVGTIVDFEIREDAANYRSQAVNLTLVEQPQAYESECECGHSFTRHHEQKIQEHKIVRRQTWCEDCDCAFEES